jgi:hypothetical protein
MLLSLLIIINEYDSIMLYKPFVGRARGQNVRIVVGAIC